MKLKQHKEKRGALVKEFRQITDGATDGVPSAEEVAKLKKIEKDIDALDELIDMEERQMQREAGIQPTTQHRDDSLGLNEKEKKGYSLLKVVRSLAGGEILDGIEKEASQAEARRLGRDPSGVFVPAEIFGDATQRRNLQRVSASGDGGFLVGEEIDYANMVELLRNQSHVMALGARAITGLRGDISIPRVLSGSTAFWLSENGQVSASKATFGQIKASPKRLAASVPHSKQLIVQSGMGIESFVREDIMAAFALELDRAAIDGAGGAAPLGILNLASGDLATGVTFGAAPTWAKIVEFETNVETANALGLPGSRYAYLTSPGSKGKWKTTAKIAGQASWLWENGDLVNGYAARSTNQVPSNRVIFGDFSQVLFFEWTGIDLTVDPYTLADQNQVKVTMQKHVDCVIRQAKAFSVSSDAGNQ
jgi:HK97 family phage major capsid protein